MNFNLNICLTLYKPDQIELNNYLLAFKKINQIIKDEYKNRRNNLINFSVISDNPKLEDNEEIKNILNKFKRIKNLEYFSTSKNRKKIGQIINKIDKIDAKFIKLCDPDDLLIPEETIKTSLEIDNIKGNTIIIHNNKKTRSIQKIVFENIDNIILWEYFSLISFNCNSIYPVNIFKKIKAENNWKFKHTVWSDDAINISMQKYNPDYTYLPNFSPYINVPHSGISKTKSKHKNKEFYNASIDLIKLLSKEYKNFNKNLITDKPNLFFLKNVLNDLILYKKNKFIKIWKYLYLLLLIDIKLRNKYNWKNKKAKSYFIRFYFLINLILNIKIK